MKNKFLIISSLVFSVIVSAQIGVNTNNPQTSFHVDGNKDNAATGTPTVAQQANDFAITSTGSIGIGNINPSSKVEVNSGAANTSGFKFSNLNASAPVSAGSTLGVDASGNVVTVPGGAFNAVTNRITTTPGFIEITPPTLNSQAFDYNLLNFTLPTAGTYLITYAVRGEIMLTAATNPSYGYITSFLSTAPAVGNVVTNTEILIVSNNDVGRRIAGRTGTGTYVRTVTGPTTFYLGVKIQNLKARIFTNQDGGTSVTYVKVSP